MQFAVCTMALKNLCYLCRPCSLSTPCSTSEHFFFHLYLISGFEVIVHVFSSFTDAQNLNVLLQNSGLTMKQALHALLDDIKKFCVQK